mgnify:CR=1 FL=1
MQCLPGTGKLAAAIVVTDNRLCGLYRGVEDHEDYGEKVADDTERCHAVRAQTIHKGVISGNAHDRNRNFRKEYGQTEPNHVTDIPERKTDALDTQFQSREVNRYITAEQINYHNQRTDRLPDSRCDGRSEQSPAERKDEQIVEHHLSSAPMASATSGCRDCSTGRRTAVRSSTP